MTRKIIKAILLGAVVFGPSVWLTWIFFTTDWRLLGNGEWYFPFLLAFVGMGAVWMVAINFFVWLNKPDK